MAVNFDLNLLYKLYQHDSLRGGTEGGLIDSKDFNGGNYRITGDKVIVTEADGDTFTYSWTQLSSKDAESLFAESLKKDDLIGEFVNTGRTGGEYGVTDDTTTIDPATGKTREQLQAEMDELRKKIDIIKTQIDENNTKIDALDQQIQAIYADIDKEVSAYIDKAEDIQEEIKEQVKKATQEEIQRYRNGEYKSTEELHEAIKKDVEGIMSDSAIAGLMDELESILNSKKAEADPLIAEKNTLEVENQTLNLEYNTLTAQERNLEDSLHGSIDEGKKPDEGQLEDQPTHEPQGFQVQGSDGTTYQYDFFVDRDNDGQLTDASEFLGAQSYAAGGKEASWNEMTALDTDGDGFVTVDELTAGNVHVVMTTVDANGNKTQKAVEATAAFGENSDLKINTKQHDATSQSDVPMGFDDFEGNELLGNFDVTLDGQTYTGYQTADTTEFLNANYTFSSGDAANDSQDVLNESLVFGADKFKYDIEKIVKGIGNKAEQNMLKYAEDICAQNGITFKSNVENAQAKETSGENAQNSENQFMTATSAQQMMAQELSELEEEIKNFDLAA